MYPIIRLKAGKEANVVFCHPWVYSGAVDSVPQQLENGALVHLHDSTGRFLGVGTYSTHSMIAVRVFGYRNSVIDREWFVARINEANQKRLLLGYGPDSDTTGYRVVFGEADGIPGLIVDRYSDVLVIQIATAGIERLKDHILDALISLFNPSTIIERSDLAVRGEEGLEEFTGLLHGDDVSAVEFVEHGNRFLAEVKTGQKTGFYLDQKDLRREVTRFAADSKTLNLFSNSGSFAVAALKGKASHVHNVDSSRPALDLCLNHAVLNDIAEDKITSECADVFNWLSTRSEPEYDLVIVDPPALVKSRQDFESGRKAYHFLNRAAMRLIRHNGILVTSSCSTYLKEDDFAHTLRRASVQAGVNLHVLRQVRQSADHPLSIYFPESAYLKSFIFLITR